MGSNFDGFIGSCDTKIEKLGLDTMPRDLILSLKFGADICTNINFNGKFASRSYHEKIQHNFTVRLNNLLLRTIECRKVKIILNNI